MFLYPKLLKLLRLFSAKQHFHSDLCILKMSKEGLPATIQLLLRHVAEIRPITSTYDGFMQKFRLSRRRQYLVAALLTASPFLYKYLKSKYEQTSVYKQHRKRQQSFAHHLQEASQDKSKQAKSKDKVQVDSVFYNKLHLLLKIVIPGYKSKEFLLLLAHTFFLVLRTWLSVVVAKLDGTLVKYLVSNQKVKFLRGLFYWFAIAIPATFTNSMIRFLQSQLAMSFRTRLTNYVHDKYFDDLVFYKICTLDSRIGSSSDQLICTDLAKFCDACASLYSNLAKPVLDTVIFNYQLFNSIGGAGMVILFVNYILTANLLRAVTPGFGKLAAVEAKLEGDFRSVHTRLITNAEEIAFYNGDARELTILEKTYMTLIRHINRIYRIRVFYNMFEDFVIKYCWSAVGLLVCSVPVFMPSWTQKAVQAAELTREVVKSDRSSRTRDFITNKKLMISLADAGGRIMYSYKELAELAGYTSRVHELLEVFDDMKSRRYKRFADDSLNSAEAIREYSLNDIRGLVRSGYDGVKITSVPIVTPSGDALVKDLTLDVKEGMHILITGPNGVGKTAIMRIIAGLWPAFRGVIDRPEEQNIIYIPQRAYLSLGTLRDQVIYPHTREDMIKNGRTDEELMEILETVHLSYLPSREGGWDTCKEWKDVFSGGEKQRVSFITKE
jgi:ATP-binding cassette subfamily D (ALD) long-chain fatty acid import protein